MARVNKILLVFCIIVLLLESEDELWAAVAKMFFWGRLIVQIEERLP